MQRIQRSQRRKARRLLHELPAQVPKHGRWHVLQGSRRRTGYPPAPQLQGGTDPVPQSERRAYVAAVPRVNRKSLSQLDFGEPL